MLREKETTRLGKFLSLVLRHKPETISICLDENGWTDVEVLLQQLNNSGHGITKEHLHYVVETNAKKRFAFNDDKTMIRANQGHSLEIELNYEPRKPPVVLYHGTPQTALPSIMASGLEKRERHHVHLSTDLETARSVGQRYGKPVVLQIATDEMHRDGYIFYCSENKVWLTNDVPPQYIKYI